jgi:hypothetical protein
MALAAQRLATCTIHCALDGRGSVLLSSSEVLLVLPE